MHNIPAYAYAPPLVPRWTIVTPPAVNALPVALDTVKIFINRPLEDTFWDAETTSLIRIAATAIENYCKITLIETVFQASVPQFFPNIRLDKRPFQNVLSVKYVAPDGEILTVDAGLWHALPIPQASGMVFLGDDLEWPETARRYDAVRIEVRAGFPEGEVPEEIMHALMMTVAALDRTRGDEQAKQGGNVTVYAMKNSRGGSIIPVEAKSLLGPHVLRFV
jgi:uncharacterized phiE125 gp8 family phage protein